MIHRGTSQFESSSIYQIFARNFSREGTLDSAMSELPRIAADGFDIIYLTPVHPIGLVNRKGPTGSPYAIADYRSVDPALGGEAALKRFFEAAHSLGLRVIMDVVFNHTAPDSVLVREHPDWFIQGSDGQPSRKVADWSDVIDLDFSKLQLRNYLIETLEQWVRLGADGFRCDVASMVPVDFWIEARQRIEAIKPTIWLAESVHKEFVSYLRAQGHYAASDGELHAAFDLTYDYDGRELFDAWIRGETTMQAYLDYVGLQSCLYPHKALKARFLENHDQLRIAHLVPHEDRLRNLTVLWMLLPGCFFCYMGQEWQLSKKPDLFSVDPLDRDSGKADFYDFFRESHLLTKGLRMTRIASSFRQVALGVVVTEGFDEQGPLYTAILNLDGRRGWLSASALGLGRLEGTNAINGQPVKIGESLELGADPILLLHRRDYRS